MKLLPLLLLPLLLLSSCPSSSGARPCKDDDQCESGEVCVIDDGDDAGECEAAGEEGEGEEGEGEGEGEEGEGEGEGEIAAVRVDVGGGFACAIDVEQRVQCWGGNSRGQLGRDTQGRRDDVPAPIAGLSEVRQLAVGQTHGCALGRLDEGEGPGQEKLWCWGESGQLGITGVTEAGELVEPQFPGGFNVDVIAVDADGDNGGELTCASDGTDTYCFGSYAPETVQNLPVPVDGLVEPAKLKVNLDGICALTGGNLATCVEVDSALQLLGCAADGRCEALDDDVAFDTDVLHACLIDGGTVSCAGDNSFGVVDPDNRGGNLPLSPLIQATDVATGTQHACAVSQLTVKCWGRPLFGATGILETDLAETEPCAGNPIVRCHGVRDVPMPDGLLGFVDVSTHGTTTCAINASGQVVCWGQVQQEEDTEAARPRRVRFFR